MNGFFKVFFGIIGFFAAMVGALAIVDRLISKNRIENDYLDCSDNSPNSEDEE